MSTSDGPYLHLRRQKRFGAHPVFVSPLPPFPVSLLSSRLVFVALAGCALLAACGADGARAANYYVAAAGDDRANGRSPATAWRSVERVNRAQLKPGDKVLFKAKDRFPGVLTPRRSGQPGRKILFSSYGSGRAKLPDGVFLRSVSHVQIDEFEIRGTSQGIAGSATGTGAKHVIITRNLITDVSIGVNAPNANDIAWRIRKNRVLRTGDSGLILEGRRAVVRDNLIANTGGDRSITYGKHGVYAKGPGTRVISNRIINFSDEGVSTRFRNARILGNVIRGGPGGIAYYRDDSGHGTTLLCRNSISGVEYGIYIDPEGLSNDDSENFRILRNRIHNPGGTVIDRPEGLSTIVTSGNNGMRSLSRLRPSCG